MWKVFTIWKVDVSYASIWKLILNNGVRFTYNHGDLDMDSSALVNQMFWKRNYYTKH